MTSSAHRVFGGVLLLGVSLAACAAESGDRFSAVAGRIFQAMRTGDCDALRAAYSKTMLDATTPAGDKALMEQVAVHCGALKRIGPPQTVSPCTAVFVADFEREVMNVTLTLDGQDKIVGYSILRPAVPERNQTSLKVPFQGEWYVLWGGETKELNKHHDSKSERHAFDFVIVDSANKTHKRDGSRNEDYYAFGQPVLAPAAGRVIDVINGVRDNRPGSMNASCACGNAVIVEHNGREVSVIGHFKLDSIRVKRGESVTQGQVLGLCGNSGMSSEPHIHLHLQNTPVMQDATGIKCVFQRAVISRDGHAEATSEASPRKGDTIKSE